MPRRELCIGILFAAAAMAFAPASELANDPSAPVFQVGVGTHFNQAKGILAGNLRMARQAGVTTIRDNLSWSGAEPTKGQYVMPETDAAYIQEALKLGLEPLPILGGSHPLYDGGDKPFSDEAVEGFAGYCGFVARHFRGKVRRYEVWNEWDISLGTKTPGTPESYAKLLKAVHRRIKAVDPSVTVMGGGITPTAVRSGWMEKLLEAGALQDLDEFSIHTYNYSFSGRERTPEAWAEWMQQVQAILRKHSGGKDVPLNITEMGWPTQIDRRGSPPELVAAFVARTYLLARTMPFLKGVWWYDFQDDGWNHAYNENNFGLVRADLTPKAGYFALADVAPLVGRAQYLGRAETSDPDVWILKFRLPDGKDVWAIWSTHEDDNWQVTLRTKATQPKPVLIREAGRVAFEREWGTRDWVAERCASGHCRGIADAPLVPDQLTLVVRDMPWLITGDLSGVSVTGVQRREFPELKRALQFLR